MKKKYVVGFLFDSDRKNVRMIMKNRPDWQAGCLNGIGGRVEESESPLEAMVREFKEEAGVLVIGQFWSHVCTLRFPKAELDVFACSASYLYEKAATCTDEQVIGVKVEDFMRANHPGAPLQEFKTVENVPVLMTLCLQYLNIPQEHE